MTLLNVGCFCAAYLDKDYYPAIYIKEIDGKHLVYLLHLDKLYRADMIDELNEATNPIAQATVSMKYNEMESPAYFIVGTSRYFKYGNRSYNIADGTSQEFNDNRVCEKILSTPLL